MKIKVLVKLCVLAGIMLGTFFYSCDTDSTDYSVDDEDIYIDSVIIEMANNSCLDEDIVASVSNTDHTITASLPSACENGSIVLTIYLDDDMSSVPASGDAVSTGTSTLTLTGNGLEETYTITLNVLEETDSDEEFISVWAADAGETITLPLIEDGDYNFVVYWGDDESSIVAAYDLSAASHTYTDAGEYTVTITGTIDGFNFYQTDESAANILDITAWGQVTLGNSDDGAYFRDCANLQITATDAPDLSGTTILKAMFRDATSFDSDINHWDVSDVTSMQDMFYGATNFDQPLDDWDVGSVTTFESMFRESGFDQDISGWDVSQATTLKAMFKDNNFNQPIGSWDISNVTSLYALFRGNEEFDQDLSGWGDKLSNVVTMREMFRESTYNGDLSAWDVSQVVSMWDMFKNASFNNSSIANWQTTSLDNMENMFGGEDCAFNQDIGGWDVSSVVNMQSLFGSNTAFNQDLSGWNVSGVLCNYNYDDGATSWQDDNKPTFTNADGSNNDYCNRDN